MIEICLLICPPEFDAIIVWLECPGYFGIPSIWPFWSKDNPLGSSGIIDQNVGIPPIIVILLAQVLFTVHSNTDGE